MKVVKKEYRGPLRFWPVLASCGTRGTLGPTVPVLCLRCLVTGVRGPTSYCGAWYCLVLPGTAWYYVRHGACRRRGEGRLSGTSIKLKNQHLVR